jgi:beta-galactosidase
LEQRLRTVRRLKFSWYLLPLACAALSCQAETLLSVDASSPVTAPETGYLQTGARTSASGHTIDVNSRYLLRDGKPWLPVMGEFHYTRFPAEYWDQELAKMRTAGIDIVSSYVIWQHHEEHEGQFDWSGDRDLRTFVRLCAKHHLYVFLRLGPWVHAEVRFGGIPDWVVAAMPTRSNDPAYLSYVDRFYQHIGEQVRGLLWKDGGPIIGVQLENEYFHNGQGEGRAHIAKLKELALKAGFDVPLYTVTAWDNTIYPARQVTPVFGSYPDAPWATSPLKLPPNEAYAFRFDSRVTGDLSPRSLAATAAGDADADAAHTPFLGAEYAGGLPSMYRRRTVVSPDDIASLLTVQIGSGVNLYGYYMFHGGRNPAGQPTREENTGIGGYNDLPMIGYDFQAPLGEYGQAHAVLAKLRPMHYFLDAFGPDLAPMVTRKPDRVSRGPDDLTTPRFSVRSLNDQGFLFFSSHVRLYPMSSHSAVRFSVKLPAGTVTFPSTAIDLPAGAYFVWPINMNLDGARLAYATAQPVTRIETDQGPVYVFRAVSGIPVEFAFDPATVTSVSTAAGLAKRATADGRSIFSGIKPGTGAALVLHTHQGSTVRIVVLSEAQAERLWVVPFQGRTRLVLSDALLFTDGQALELRSKGNPQFRLGMFPALTAAPTAQPALRRAGNDGVFEIFAADLPSRNTEVSVNRVREAQPVPAIAIGGPAQAALQPYPEVFGRSAAWTITVPANTASNMNDAYLQLDYVGDVARLFAGTELIDDEYFNGLTWEIGLKRFAEKLNQPFTLTILPLRQDAPIYLEQNYRPAISAAAQAAQVLRARMAPEYRLRLE